MDRDERRAIRARKRRRAVIFRAILFLLLLAVLGVAIVMVTSSMRRQKNEQQAEKERREAEINAEEERLEKNQEVIATAAKLAVVYDYDGAIAALESVEGYANDPALVEEIAKYTAEKTSLVAVDPNTVPHIFFHSLVVDENRAFDWDRWGESTVGGINAWMTTIEEFDAMMEQMYNNGYVLVRLRDLVNETVNDDGSVTFTPNNSLLLPPGKKALVLSIDDWSYYHSYDGKGMGDKAVLDENGDVKVQYTDAEGNVLIGDYDVVPRLNTFIEEHPGFSYKGARGLLAMTGYNGCFGYRTDTDYVKQEKLQSDQKAWLDEHPGFDEAARQEEIAEARKIADKCKEDGWEFASHTWGHLSVTNKSLEDLQKDHERWKETVENIVGPTDTIIFAHGNDIGSWKDYDASTNPVYAYYKDQGFHFYCNVDASTKYWVQIRSEYVRQGRIDCDGIQMWRAISGAAKINVFEDLFDVNGIFSKKRPTPVSASGKS